MRRSLLSSAARLACATLLLPALAACPPDGGEGEGEGGEGEGEGEGEADAFTLVSTTTVDADILVAPGFAIAARPDGRAAIAWFEQIDEIVQCDLFGGGTVDGDVYRLMLGDEQADGTIVQRVIDPFVPNVKENSVSLAVTADGRVLAAYMGGETTRTFCGSSDLMLATENGATFTTQAVATTSDTGAACRGDAGGDPYCGRGEVVGLYPAISVNGDQVAISYMDTHFGFGDDDITQTDLELAQGTVGGAFTVRSVNTESGGGYYGDATVTAEGVVVIGHNVTANNQFVDENGDEFVVRDGIYAEVVAVDGTVTSTVVNDGVFTASRVATAARAGSGLFVAAHNRGDEGLILFQSVDNGATWQPSPIEQLGRSGRDPNLFFASDGRLVAVYGHCRDDENQDGCSARDDGVRFAVRGNDGRFTKFTTPSDAEDLEAIGLDAAIAGDEIVTVSLNSSQNTLVIHRVRIN
jgi:hypothetical protein